VRVVGLASAPDAEGYARWVEVEPEIQDAKGGDGHGQIVRVNSGAIHLPTRCRLAYGGGVESGQIGAEYIRRPYVGRGHRLTQYVRQRGKETPIPAGAYALEVAPGSHDGADPIAFALLAGKQVLSVAASVRSQERFTVGGANTFKLTTSPQKTDLGDHFFTLDWLIDL
jgi:hypothetical protein